jgi:hypothetical protein
MEEEGVVHMDANEKIGGSVEIYAADASSVVQAAGNGCASV